MSDIKVMEGPYTYGRVTADGQIKASPGFVHAITIAPIGAITAGVITIYDSLTETGTIIYSENFPTTGIAHSVLLDAKFLTGLYVGYDGTVANVQVTVSYE